MREPIRFKSVLNPGKYGYEWTNDSMTFWDQLYRNPFNFLSGAAGYFETLGDGDCQHTPLMPSPLALFSDYAISFSAHILANAGDAEFCDRLAIYPLEVDFRPGTAQFLAGIRYNSDKAQYVNLPERKISSADSKRHDKRWTEVPRWADGSIASAVQLYWMFARPEQGAPSEAFKRYAVECYFWDELYNTAPEGDEWPKLTEYRQRIVGSANDSWRTLLHAIGAIRALHNAKRCMDCAIHNSTPREQIAA
jgi:hypothetical protein